MNRLRKRRKGINGGEEQKGLQGKGRIGNLRRNTLKFPSNSVVILGGKNNEKGSEGKEGIGRERMDY